MSLELFSEKDYFVKVIFASILSKVLLVNHLREHFLVISLFGKIEGAEKNVKPKLVFIFIATYLIITFCFELGYHF